MRKPPKTPSLLPAIPLNIRGNTLVNGDVSISGNVAILGGLVATIKSSAFLSTSIKDTLTSTGQTYLGQTLIQPNADINPALMIVTREAIPLNITTSNATNAININGKDLIALETTGTTGKVYTYAVYINFSTAVSAVAPQATIIPVKLVEDGIKPTAQDIVQGIEYAIKNGARIIAITIDKTRYTTIINKAIKTAHDQHNAINYQRLTNNHHRL